MNRILALLVTLAVALAAGSARAAAPKGRVLLVASSARELQLKDGRSVPVGYFLDELAVPAQALLAAGYDVVVATPDGSTPAMDARSTNVALFHGDAAALKSALDFVETYPGLRHPRTLKSIVADGLDGLDAVYVPGGHAPMGDLVQDPDLGAVLRHFHARSKPTAFLCHGPVAALSTLPKAAEYRKALASGDRGAAGGAATGWPYAGYRMTVFSNAEEEPVEKGAFHGELAFHAADALRGAGARLEQAAPRQPFVVRDRELITGQNPASDQAIAEALLEALRKPGRT